MQLICQIADLHDRIVFRTDRFVHNHGTTGQTVQLFTLSYDSEKDGLIRMRGKVGIFDSEKGNSGSQISCFLKEDEVDLKSSFRIPYLLSNL